MGREDITHPMYCLLHPFERARVSYFPAKLTLLAWPIAVVSPLKVPLRASLVPQTFSEVLQRHVKLQWVHVEVT